MGRLIEDYARRKMHYRETKFGFEYGALTIERCYSDEKSGLVVLQVKTPRQEFDIYCTKTGLLRIYPKKGKVKVNQYYPCE